MSTHDDLRAIALTEFALAGYSGTSLQRIAELAGLSKSSVLYHFDSKEALLEAAIGPAIDGMEKILSSVDGTLVSETVRREFIEQFVDFLLQHRLEVHMFINQGLALEDVPVIERANAIVGKLATFFSSAVASVEDQLRFGVALGGAAYVLSALQESPLQDSSPPDSSLGAQPPIAHAHNEVRDALITIVSELLAPISANSLTKIP